MMPRKATQFWLPALALAAMVVWYGCEQKGDISPAGSGQRILTSIESVTASPSLIRPGETAVIEARIRTEANEPAAGENVRISVTSILLGTFCTGRCDTTVATDSLGYARAIYTAPGDTGMVPVRVELLSMGEAQSTTVHVSDAPLTEGLLSVWADADWLFADNGASSTRIYARLRNEANNPIGGATVNFSTNIGTVVSPAVTDNTSGIAQTTLTSTNEFGQALVVAHYGVQTDTAAVMFVQPYEASEIRLSSARPTLMAGQDTSLISAYVLDPTGMPVVDSTLVLFGTVPGHPGQLTAGAVRTASGWATTNLIAGPTTGIAIVTASTGGTARDTVTVEVIAGPPADITLTADADTLLADGNASTTVTAIVWDSFLNPAGQQMQVIFTATGGTVIGSGTVGPDGHAVTTFRAGLEVGPATVTAAIADVQRVITLQLIGTTPGSVSLAVDPNVLPADGISQASLRALVLDAQNQPVSNGTSVTFTSEFGILTAGQQVQSRRGDATVKQTSAWTSALNRSTKPSGSPVSGRIQNDQTIRLNGTTAAYTTTTTDGYAYATLTSPTEVATDHIVASAGSLSDTKVVNYVTGVPVTLMLTAQTDTLAANGIAVDTITAHVEDGSGHALANVEVLFSTTIGNITLSRVTDINGDARVAFTSSQTGIAHITATAGDAVDTYTVYLVPGNPNSILLTYYPNSVGVRGSGRNETLLVTASVRDASNNPVIDGTLVTFNINGSPGGGDYLSSTDPLPTINGEASVSYNSGTVSGSVRIRAVCMEISALSTEILIYAGPPYVENIEDACLTSHMTVYPMPCSMFGMDYVGDSVRIDVLVGDRYNNPVTEGTAVYFTTSAGVITTNTGFTDATGHASVTLYGGNPLPTVDRWLNAIRDPNTDQQILCNSVPSQDGVAKVVASAAGVDAYGDSVSVWATTDVYFLYREPVLEIRSVTINGDPNAENLYIGESANINFAVFDQDYWPLVDSSVVSLSANAGMIYPEQIVMGCRNDTSYTVSFFNNLTVQDDPIATPVLVTVETRLSGTYAFTRTLTLLNSLPPDSVGMPGKTADNLNDN